MSIQEVVTPRDEFDELNFENLLAGGIELLQELAGDNWSDYNLHDPGVTLLEQLCFALTDVVYRSDADISQYFIGKNGKLNLPEQGLYGPTKVLSSGPVNAKDIEALLLSKIQGLNRVFLNPNNERFGEYQLAFGVSDSEQARIKESMYKLYHANRLLCSNVPISLKEVRSESISLLGAIEIDNGFGADATLASILLAAQNYISPTLAFTPYDELLTNDTSIDKVLQGPFSAIGVLNRQERKALVASDLSDKLLDIKGVKQVKELLFVLADGEPKTILENDESTAYTLLMPESTKAIRLQLLQNNEPVSVEMTSLLEHMQQQRMQNKSNASAMIEHPDIFPTISGDYWPLDEHYPIFQQLPANYLGSGHHSSCATDKHQKAHNRQLQGYLMLFEQFIVNNFRNLSQIKTLFSLTQDADNSYFSQPLGYEQAKSLYLFDGEEIEQTLNCIIQKGDDYLDRRNRILNYLLALYAESFPDEALKKLDGGANYETLSKDLIRAKIHLLKNIPEIGYRRMLGQNMSLPLGWSSSKAAMNMSGLQLKTSLMLGLWDVSQRSLLGVYKQLNLTLISKQPYSQISAGSNDSPSRIERLNSMIMEHFTPVFGNASQQNQLTKLSLEELTQLHYQLKMHGFIANNQLGKDIIEHGLQAESYRVGYVEKHSAFLLIFKTDANQWIALGSYYSKADAIKAASLFRLFIYNVQLLIDCNNQILLKKIPLTISKKHQFETNPLSLSDIFDEQELTDKHIREYFRPAISVVSNEYQTLAQIQSSAELKQLHASGLFKQGLCSEFLSAGVDASRYRIGLSKNPCSIILTFRYKQKTWIQLAAFEFNGNDAEEKAKATKDAKILASTCQQFLYALNRLGEGMHVLEHALLTTSSTSIEKPNYQLSVVLPNWLARFKSRDFQAFIETLLEQNAPAHLLCHVHLLDVNEMQKFESIYRDWYEAKDDRKEEKASLLTKLIKDFQAKNTPMNRARL